MKSAEDIRQCFQKSTLSTNRDRHEAIFAEILRAQEQSGKTTPASYQPVNWSNIMRNKSLRYSAAAAVIVIGVLASFYFLPNGDIGIAGVTFADVVKPVLNAQTIVLDVVVGNEQTGPVMHEIIMGSRIRRTYSNMPNKVNILDMDSAKMLVLDTARKTASYVQLDDVEDDVEFLRETIVRLQDGSRAQELGEREIEGKKVVGFTAGDHNQKITIWADPKTARPVRIELVLRQLSVFLKNFEFDVPIEASLLSMDVPPGYSAESG